MVFDLLEVEENQMALLYQTLTGCWKKDEKDLFSCTGKELQNVLKKIKKTRKIIMFF